MIRLYNIKKQYSQFQLHCSLEVPQNRVTALIGPNGAGKSTTFKAILGLIHVDDGEIELFGKPLHTLTIQEQATLGIALSNSCFCGYLQIQDIIPILAQLYPKFQKEYFLQQCQHFDLPLTKKINDFSTGMKAKLKVLIAISHQARLLILDEPTTGLDVLAREELLDILREYMIPGDRSILISSHISSDLEGFCDEFYLIDKGKILLHEETNILLDNYGILKVTDKQYPYVNPIYLTRKKKEPYGYRLLTNKKQFYQDNSPELIIEKCCIDEIILMMTKGEHI